ncbi:MAG: type II toxin-antitoxin system VapC family toxin [Nitrospirota bacterium]
MSLDRIAPGSRVFIDANVFIYHFTGASDECSALLERCEQGDLLGITSANVILEVLHKLMMVEAVNKGLVSPPNIVGKLQKQPQTIKQLSEYFTNAQKIEQMGIDIKPISALTILKSQPFRLRYGLMTNNSLIATIMEEEGITVLATNDGAFSVIEGIDVVSPEDVA